MSNPGRKPNPNATRRSAARLAAVQTLYSMEMTGVDIEQALRDFHMRLVEDPPRRMAQPDMDLVEFLVRGVSAEQAGIDVNVGRSLTKDWTVDRLESVLRAILRAGTYEMKARPKTPARVAISEYVDVAKAFYAGPEPGLVNAVLDRVGRELRPEEFQPGGANGSG